MSNELPVTTRPTGFPFWDMMLGLRTPPQGTYGSNGATARTLALGARAAGNAAEAVAVEEVIPLAEETLNLEARTVPGATTRVRRYVVETPVERQIVLRTETVVVERRMPGTFQAAPDALTEKTVEATDTAQVVVVHKNVRLREEVVLRLEGSERTETVRDTVRRDEIEIMRPETKALPQRDPAA